MKIITALLIVWMSVLTLTQCLTMQATANNTNMLLGHEEDIVRIEQYLHLAAPVLPPASRLQ